MYRNHIYYIKRILKYKSTGCITINTHIHCKYNKLKTKNYSKRKKRFIIDKRYTCVSKKYILNN
ncbi:hypothetical protein PFAG_05585 [Plasmodium falciparum Santa Lucia]|uniref:Uncharacterized protein n=4 Tax=Plasmodium falciparum TaxID=5833 RepID=A0A024X074_PLAFC|nr:hypothetical protein PFNF135_05798 [Plasmodium falciparum NF135/5.C10]ETW58460.1 hypothetical protein PFMC_05560 [Plasmodium falciparum CAMP/Malaysia]EUR62947.1 hypothetical protein PFBG_05551 [Plasmodium falciparum 7G8]EUT79011.1 hypothetical protein PFAG_05585 [Plasmodium falciparum Santa Lucia]